MRRAKSKHILGLYYGEKVPRKSKKKILGRLMNKSDLRKLLDSVVLGPEIKTMYERRETNTGLFCPHCGCRHYVGYGSRAAYPEHWETFYCLRCSAIVGYIDNSPFVHALECKEFDYDPTF